MRGDWIAIAVIFFIIAPVYIWGPRRCFEFLRGKRNAKPGAPDPKCANCSGTADGNCESCNAPLCYGCDSAEFEDVMTCRDKSGCQMRIVKAIPEPPKLIDYGE